MSLIINEDIQIISSRLRKVSKRLEGKTLLISGGAGFLGSYIILTIDYLNKNILRKPCRVISIDNYITGRKRKALDKVDSKYIKFLKGDVTKKIKYKGRIDFIMHAAGLASPVYYQKYPIETIESAILGAKNLLEIAQNKKVKSFMYFSSSEIYGDPSPEFIPTNEDYRGNVSPIGPRACYDESKRVGETLSMTYFTKYNTKVKIVRPFNIYGPGMFADDYRVVPMFIYSALHGNPLRVHDKGMQTRTFCYISDAVIGFMLILLSDKNGEVYNVGNDYNEITIYRLAKLVSKILNNSVKVIKVPYPNKYPQDEPKRRRPDLSKIKKAFMYAPNIDLEVGLRRTIDWYKEEGF